MAAIHDPSGQMFNVSPVVTIEDGTVITEESLRRRREKVAQLSAADPGLSTVKDSGSVGKLNNAGTVEMSPSATSDRTNAINPDRRAQIEQVVLPPTYRSINQIKRLAKFEPRPPPPRPTRPDHIPLFDGEEDWLALWDLEDEDVERRVIREKKRKAAARKALRTKQQSGKAERRMARDDKRRIYRDIKLEWKTIKGTLLSSPFRLITNMI